MTYTHNTHDIHTQHDIARQDIQDMTWISRLSLLSSLLFLFVPFVFLFSLLNGRMKLYVQNGLGHLSLPHTVAPAVTALGARPQARTRD